MGHERSGKERAAGSICESLAIALLTPKEAHNLTFNLLIYDQFQVSYRPEPENRSTDRPSSHSPSLFLPQLFLKHAV